MTDLEEFLALMTRRGVEVAQRREGGLVFCDLSVGARKVEGYRGFEATAVFCDGGLSHWTIGE